MMALFGLGIIAFALFVVSLSIVFHVKPTRSGASTSPQNVPEPRRTEETK